MTKITQNQTWRKQQLHITAPHTLIILVVYRPPDTHVVQFISGLTYFLDEYVNQHGCHTILGDLNIQINDENDSVTINFNDFLNMFDL